MKCRKIDISWNALIILLLGGVSSSHAYAGSINSNSARFTLPGTTNPLQDPCAFGMEEGTAPACTAALADRYKKRCYADWGGLRRFRCLPGDCNEWRMTGRSPAVVVDTPTLACTKQLVFTQKYPPMTLTPPNIDLGATWQSAWCLKGNAIFSAAYRTEPLPLGAQTYPVSRENLATAAHGTRIFVRGPAPKTFYLNPFRYHLSMQDALCSYHKYCDPLTRKVKTGVDLSGELPGAGFQWTGAAPTPIGSLCKFDVNFFMANSAVSCVVNQMTGATASEKLASLCATPDPMRTMITIGKP